MPDAGNCLFCRIIAGELPSKIIYSDSSVAAFRDINPQAPEHILIVPKKHIVNLLAVEDADAALLGEIQLVAVRVAKERKMNGFRLVLNNGKIAGQSVDHLHYHLLGGRRLAWPPG